MVRLNKTEESLTYPFDFGVSLSALFVYKKFWIKREISICTLQICHTAAEVFLDVALLQSFSPDLCNNCGQKNLRE